MIVTALCRYGALGASSRVRMLQYRGALERAGIALQVAPLLDDRYLQCKYEGRAVWTRIAVAYVRRLAQVVTAARRSDLLWIEKELWPWAPAWFERVLWRGKPVVLDFDDAIFHHYDLHRSALVRRLFGRKIDRLMGAATLVVAGNEYLAQRARAAGAARVVLLPTVVDLERYAVPRARGSNPHATIVIGWIGSPATVHYLESLAAPLARLAHRHAIELRVVGARIAMPGVPVKTVEWSEATEAAAIAACDIGIMPLPDSPWERGKCAYKLIQYMACELPVVASPVGANCGVVSHGVNGFLAGDAAQWEESLARLAADAALRREFGRAGRATVQERYSLQVAAPYLIALLKSPADGEPPAEI